MTEKHETDYLIVGCGAVLQVMFVAVYVFLTPFVGSGLAGLVWYYKRTQIIRYKWVISKRFVVNVVKAYVIF